MRYLFAVQNNYSQAAYEADYRVAEQDRVATEINTEFGKVKEDGAAHQAQSHQSAQQAGTRNKDEDGSDQFGNTGADTSPGFHSQLRE